MSVVLTSVEGFVATVSINRPQRKNALTIEAMVALRESFAALSSDRSVRVIVLCGVDGNFCSGADLSGGDAPSGPPGFLDRMHVIHDMVASVAKASQPVIAAVSGVAVGGGMSLALACDIVVADETARFSQIFVKRGLNLDMGGSWALTRRVGLGVAKRLVYTADFVEAPEAARLGLVDELVSSDALSAALSLAQRIAVNAPVAVKLSKRILNEAYESSLGESLDREAAGQAICFGSQDVVEGISAFLSKRDPEFMGK